MSGFKPYAKCDGCGTLYETHFDSLHFAPDVCRRCGRLKEGAGRFNTNWKMVRRRKVSDATWWKPWTWGDAHFEKPQTP